MENEEEEGTSWVGRIAAVAALLLAVGVAAWLLVGKDDGYKVHVRFQAATNVVKGNLVQVAGRRVGTIEEIELTEDGQAELTLKIDDEDLVPLRTGTRATLRIASLSGSASMVLPSSWRVRATINSDMALCHRSWSARYCTGW